MRGKFGIFIVAGLMSACVSLKDYRAKQAELGELNMSNKELKGDVKVLKKQNKVLWDTIKHRNTHAPSGKTGAAKTPAVKAPEPKTPVAKIPAKTPAKTTPGKPRTYPGISVVAPPKDNSHSTWIKENWSRDTNSARSITWLKQEEKDVIYWINKARLDPKGFLKKYVMPEYQEDSSNVYLASLVDYMGDMMPLPALKPNKELYNSAICHAQTAGAKGHVGHDRIDKSCPVSFRGECISFGLEDAFDIVMQLLVDEGVPSLGHRYICFGTFTEIGVGQAAHKSYRTNAVLDFK